MRVVNLKSSNVITLMVLALSMTVFLSACHKNPDNVIPGIVCDDINSETVWADRGEDVADYTLNCIITVNSKLTIEPGVIIHCGPNAGIIVETSGSLTASGTSVKPIQFKNDANVAGVWKGLYIKSNNVLNELNHCRISNGGSGSFDGNATKVANIRVALQAQLKITNCHVAKSGKDGLLVDGLDSDELNPITAFAGNTFEDNGNYPVSAVGTMGTVMDGTGSSYIGNTHNQVLMRGGRLYGSHTWKKMNVPYLVQNILSAGYDTHSGNLTIEPGTTVQFAADAGLCTGDYSSTSWLSLVGTSAERISITGETAVPGSWKGIAFQSTSASNRISYADISYGGSSSFTGNTSQRGNILAGAWSAGSFTIANATVTGSAGYGIYATMPSPAITVPGSVTYSANASGNYFHE